MRNLLGGKGCNLAEMTGLGMPIPQGFTVTTEACTEYYNCGKTISKEIEDQIFEALAWLCVFQCQPSKCVLCAGLCRAGRRYRRAVGRRRRKPADADGEHDKNYDGLAGGGIRSITENCHGFRCQCGRRRVIHVLETGRTAVTARRFVWFDVVFRQRCRGVHCGKSRRTNGICAPHEQTSTAIRTSQYAL